MSGVGTDISIKIIVVWSEIGWHTILLGYKVTSLASFTCYGTSIVIDGFNKMNPLKMVYENERVAKETWRRFQHQ